jgi:hypothetical protein
LSLSLDGIHHSLRTRRVSCTGKKGRRVCARGVATNQRAILGVATRDCLDIRSTHTKPTPPDQTDTTGQVFFQNRTSPTSPDHFDRLQPPHNPPVVGSIPTGPTNSPTNVLFLLHSQFTFRRWFLLASEKAIRRPSCRIGDTKVLLHFQNLGH